MEGKDWIGLLTGQIQVTKLMETNQYTERFGLTLTQEDAALISAEQKQALQAQKRVEFSESILPEII